jgi:putative addiction module killer protein
VLTRITRLRLGNFGDCKIIKRTNIIFELRIDYGPGYRIYFGKKDQALVILLIGGDKKSQESDIAKTKKYWEACQEE